MLTREVPDSPQFNCFVSAGYVLAMRKRIKLTNFKDWDSMFYNNLLSIPVLVVFSLMFETWSSANLALNLCVSLGLPQTLRPELTAHTLRTFPPQPGGDAHELAQLDGLLWRGRGLHLVLHGVDRPHHLVDHLCAPSPLSLSLCITLCTAD